MENDQMQKIKNYEAVIVARASSLGIDSEKEIMAYKKACFYASSQIVPSDFQNNPASCFIAIQIADEINVSARWVMNSIFMIKGRPGWYAQAQITLLKKLTGLQLEYEVSEEKQTVRAFVMRNHSGTLGIGLGKERVEGPLITMEMAKAENWTTNKKYSSMPINMLSKRAATFFIRTHYPEVLCGFVHSAEELKDMITVSPTVDDSNILSLTDKQAMEEKALEYLE